MPDIILRPRQPWDTSPGDLTLFPERQYHIREIAEITLSGDVLTHVITKPTFPGGPSLDSYEPDWSRESLELAWAVESYEPPSRVVVTSRGQNRYPGD